MEKIVTKFALFIAAELLINVPALSQETLPLEANYIIAGESITDPPDDEKKDRVSIYIRGEGAKAIFEAMPEKEMPDPCSDALVTKTAGGLTCIKGGPADYRCGVSIKLDTGETKNAWVC